jgi:hypothetical protein
VNEPDVSDKPVHIRAASPLALHVLGADRRKQLGSLLAVDEAIAGMLAALKEAGKLADTLIVFTSDNGLGWGEHRRAHKLVPYEESIRVPLVVRYDRLGSAPRSAPQTALNVDLAPTIAAAAGIEVSTEGRDLLPLILRTQRGWRGSFLFEHYMPPRWNVPAYCAFRGGRWKYVQYATGEEELYNLAGDPYELRNHAGNNRRSAMIIGYRTRVSRSTCRPPGFRPLPPCTRTGSSGRDRILGSSWPDWICSRRGPDRINVQRGGRDVVRCGAGFDRVRAGRRDRLIGCEDVRRGS